MRYTVVAFIILIFSACESNSRKYEDKAMLCWGKAWMPQTDSSGKAFAKGIKAFDDYLFSKGYLGKRTQMDYINLAHSNQDILIPDTVKDFKLMKTTFYSEFAGAPDVGAMASCINSNIIDHMKDLDSNDVMFRFGKIFKALAQAGAPDNEVLLEFFRTLKQEEFDRPLIKTFFFFSLPSKHFHISFQEGPRKLPSDSLPPPPPPPPPPPIK